MEAIHTQKNTAFLPATRTFAAPRKRAANRQNHYQRSSSYTETLLREYKTLVELLTRIDLASFRTMQSEINTVIDELKQWFDQPNAQHNTLDIYWNMRRLRQRIQSKVRHVTVM